MLRQTQNQPPVLQAIAALDTWNELAVYSTRPGSADCWRLRSSAKPASPPPTIRCLEISASKPCPSIAAGIGIARPRHRSRADCGHRGRAEGA